MICVRSLITVGFNRCASSAPRSEASPGVTACKLNVTYQDGKIPVQHREIIVPVSSESRTYQFTFKDAAVHFDQSAAAAEAAISSFTLGQANVAAAQTGNRADQQGEADSSNWLLIAVGALALILVVTAAYLLLRRPAAAR